MRFFLPYFWIEKLSLSVLVCDIVHLYFPYIIQILCGSDEFLCVCVKLVTKKCALSIIIGVIQFTISYVPTCSYNVRVILS